MAMTGVSVCPECVTTYEDLKSKSKSQGIEFKIEGDKIVVVKAFDKGTSYGDFLATVPQNEARYYVWDYAFETDDGIAKSKIFFMVWNPDSGKVRSKMMYSGSADALKAKIGDGVIVVQANDTGDLEDGEIKSRALKGR